MDLLRFRVVNIRNCLSRVCKEGIWKRSWSVTCRDFLSAIGRRYLSRNCIDRSPLWLGWHMCHSTGMPLWTPLPSITVALPLQITQLSLSCFSLFRSHSFIISMFLRCSFVNTLLFSHAFLSTAFSLLSVTFLCNTTSPSLSLYGHDVVDSAWTWIQFKCHASPPLWSDVAIVYPLRHSLELPPDMPPLW